MSVEENISIWRVELLDYLKEMTKFSSSSDYAETLTQISAMTSRASYMRSVVVVDPASKARRFRLDEIDPFLKEADRQFKVWSRVIAVRSQEWNSSNV